ncbi:hypothetical protein GCM10007161_14050 [Ignatzschineria indica]|nr:hypothetical protein GCM10007161_14050 [Ignatzschineria indica]
MVNLIDAIGGDKITQAFSLLLRSPSLFLESRFLESRCLEHQYSKIVVLKRSINMTIDRLSGAGASTL